MLLPEGFVAVAKFAREYVAYPDSVAAGLVHIGRTYSLEGGAYLGLAFCCFAGRIQGPVGREDEVGALADPELSADVAALSLYVTDFLCQNHRVDHDSVANYIDSILPEDSGRNG